MTTEVAAPPAATPPPDYPVTFQVGRPASQSRITNFPLIGTWIRILLLIPNIIVLYFLSIAAIVVWLIATVAILFTGRYPKGMFDFYVGVTRWGANVYSYLFHLHDEYPPFSTEQRDYPVRFSVDYPEKLNRLLNFPYFGGAIIKPVLCIPHFLVLVFLVFAATVVLIIAPFAILFTGSYPEGMHRFTVGVGRWTQRVNAYINSLTDRYPPFSLQ